MGQTATRRLDVCAEHVQWRCEAYQISLLSGNLIIVGSTTSVSLALVWGGITYPWVSPQVLTPLIVGAVGFGAFVLFEAFVPAEPIVPLRLFTNRTSAAG